MKKILFKSSIVIVVIFLSVLFIAPAMLYADAVTQQAIPGVTAPVTGAAPVTTITASAQYTGTVAWAAADNPFNASTVYTATITLTAVGTYEFINLAANYFTVAGANATSPAVGVVGQSTIVVTAVFPATATTVSLIAIDGVTAPVTGAVPVTAITATAQYTGTVA